MKNFIKAANFLNKYIYLCYEHYEKKDENTFNCFKQTIIL